MENCRENYESKRCIEIPLHMPINIKNYCADN